MEPLTLSQILNTAGSGPVDSGFVQHAISDISARFFGYLVFILAYSTVVHGSVRAAFALTGLNLHKTWWDDAAVGVLGVFFALAMDLNAMFYIAGVTPSQYVTARTAWAGLGVPGGSIPASWLFFVCNITTGALVIGGRKAIVGIAEEFQKGLEAIKAIMSRKANGGGNGA